MTVLVDTSALYALLNEGDQYHRRAADLLPQLRAKAPLITHNYVVLETTSIVQRRLGPAATRALLEDLAPLLEIVWVNEELHNAGVTALLAATRRRVSLVDWVSFELMRRRGIETAFAFDRDFALQGFETVP